MKENTPDLMDREKLISFAATNTDQMMPSKTILKLITKDDPKYLEKEKLIEEVLPEYLAEKQIKDLNVDAKEAQINLEFELKQGRQKEEEEFIDTGTMKNKEEVVEDIISRILGEDKQNEIENLKEKELDLLYEIINHENDEIIDLKGLISEQTNSINRVMKVLTQNWKEILNKIKDYYGNNPIPSNLYQEDLVFIPKEGEGRYFKEEYECINLTEKKRERTPEPRRKKEEGRNFQDYRDPEYEKNLRIYENKLNKIKTDRIKFKMDEDLDVREIELKNWIKNLNYMRIQENIDNGRIRRWNYSKYVQDDLLYYQKIGKINLKENQN